jgi:hypothetical protein
MKTDNEDWIGSGSGGGDAAVDEEVGISRTITYGLGKLHTGTTFELSMLDFASMECSPNTPGVTSVAYVTLLPLSTNLAYATGVAETSSAVFLMDSLATFSLGPTEGPTTSTLSMTPAGATLCFGLPGVGPSISLTAEGISIITPRLSIIADSGISITCPATTIVGDVTITGNLSIEGSVELTGDLVLTGDLTATGDTTMTGDLEVTGEVEIM